MAFDKSAYDQEYTRQHIIRKMVPFNRLQPEDLALLRHAESTGNFTGYVKGLIREDMERGKADGQETSGT